MVTSTWPSPRPNCESFTFGAWDYKSRCANGSHSHFPSEIRFGQVETRYKNVEIRKCRALVTFEM